MQAALYDLRLDAQRRAAAEDFKSYMGREPNVGQSRESGQAQGVDISSESQIRPASNALDAMLNQFQGWDGQGQGRSGRGR